MAITKTQGFTFIASFQGFLGNFVVFWYSADGSHSLFFHVTIRVSTPDLNGTWGTVPRWPMSAGLRMTRPFSRWVEPIRLWWSGPGSEEAESTESWIHHQWRTARSQRMTSRRMEVSLNANYHPILWLRWSPSRPSQASHFQELFSLLSHLPPILLPTQKHFNILSSNFTF